MHCYYYAFVMFYLLLENILFSSLKVAFLTMQVVQAPYILIGWATEQVTAWVLWGQVKGQHSEHKREWGKEGSLQAHGRAAAKCTS